MTMKRRSFLAGLVGSLAAPAIVRADSLMKLWVPPPRVIAHVQLLDPRTGAWLNIANRVAESGVSRLIFTDHTQRVKDLLLTYGTERREVTPITDARPKVIARQQFDPETCLYGWTYADSNDAA